MGKLTAKFVEKAEAGTYGDGDGLRLEVKGAAKSWVYRYTIKGRTRYMGLGGFPKMGLAAARERATELRALTEKGTDPLEQREQERIAAEAAKQAAKVKGTTFKDYAEQYIGTQETSWKSPIHRQQWRNTLKTYAYPMIGDMVIGEIDTPDILRVLKPIWSSKLETAARLRGRIEKILAAAKVEQLRAGENPARLKEHLDFVLPKKKDIRKRKPVKHHPAVPWREMPAFMARLRAKRSLSARALEFIVLTAARADEACSARWEEIDLATAVWTVPGDRTKTGVEHRVPLSPRVLEILSRYMPAMRKGFIFPSPSKGGQPIDIATPLKLIKDMRCDATTHGMRSAFRSWAAAATHFPRDVCEKALAHAIESDTEAAYQRDDLLNKRRELMAAWDKFCSSDADSHLPPILESGDGDS